MSGPVARLIDDHQAATGTQSREYCDPFVSTTWALVEINDALDLARRQVTAMQTARLEKSLERMAAAQAQLDRLLAQAGQLSEVVGRVLRTHAGRTKGNAP